MRRRRLVAALLCAAVTPACAPHAPADGETAPPPAAGSRAAAANDVILLSVENHNWSDVVVSIVRNGHTQRLGTVTAESNAVLRLPAFYGEASTALQLVARPIGDPPVYRSERFVVMPGQQVTSTLEGSLVRSSLAVY